MIAVIFEAWPKAHDGADRYFELAGLLRPLLDGIDGFLSVERFESLAEPGKFLSLSFWRDEAAISAWGNTMAHRASQSEGRNGILRDYRLRIATTVRDYGMHDRQQAPADSQIQHVAG